MKHRVQRTSFLLVAWLYLFIDIFGASLSTDSTGRKIEPQCERMSNAKSLVRRFGIVEQVQQSGAKEKFDIFRLSMDDDGTFPNNKEYPLLLYKSAFLGTQSKATQMITGSGQWTSPWVWGIFPFHHYHSNAWELLLCTRGEAIIQMGGPTGPMVQVATGDLMLVPPGLAHKQILDSGGFTLLGSYPKDSELRLGPVDTLREAPTVQQRENIASCPLPPKDPFFGWTMDDVGLRKSIDSLE